MGRHKTNRRNVTTRDFTRSFRKRQHIYQFRSVPDNVLFAIVVSYDDEIRRQIVHNELFSDDYSLTKSEF